MTTKEKESRDFLEAEKVYPNPGVKPMTHILYVLACVIFIVLGVLLRMYTVEFCEWLWDVALITTVNNFKNLGLGMIIVFSAILVAYLIVALSGYSIDEIALTKEGIVLRRKRSPIVIQKITDIKEASRGRVLRLTGLNPEGKTIKKRISWSHVGRKKWGEFKEDVAKIQSGDQA